MEQYTETIEKVLCEFASANRIDWVKKYKLPTDYAKRKQICLDIMWWGGF
jgi:hypothetical protein